MHSADTTDAALGRQAARELWTKGLDAGVVEDPLTENFANAAIAELETLQRNTPGVLREVLRGAEISAEQLNVEAFHGLIEVVQNADDHSAREVRVALRSVGGSRHLLVAHDGATIKLPHVLAMTLAFVSTKRDDPRSKGRFGIGLKTLGRLGHQLSVHCGPYHFAIEGNRLGAAPRVSTIEGFFDPDSADTLFELQLREEFDAGEFESWFAELDSSSFLFLDNVRIVRLVDLRTGSDVAKRELEEVRSEDVSLAGLDATCRRTLLRQPGSARRWLRYQVEAPVPAGLQRSHKATGESTPLGVAVAIGGDETHRLYAGLPLGIETSMPLSLNAQFDVTTDRQAVQHDSDWNDWLVSALAEVVSGVVLDCFAEAPAIGWSAVPLRNEALDGSDRWLATKLSSLVGTVQSRVGTDLRLEVQGQEYGLSSILSGSRQGRFEGDA